MEDYFAALKQSFLFKETGDETIRAVLNECGFVIKKFNKGDILLLNGEKTKNIGIVLQGTVFAEKSTPGGRCFSVANISAGGIFGDILAGSHVLSPVSVIAQSLCTVMFLPFASLMNKASYINGSHVILQNLVGAIADKYFALDARLDLLLEKNLRTRIFAYVKEKAAGKDSFSHNLTRQQLADYLGCERAALCRELSRMKRDGIIAYDKRSFCILNNFL